MSPSNEELEKMMPATSLEWTEEAQEAMKRVPFFVRKSVVRSIEEFAKEKNLTVVDAQVVARARQEKEGGARPGPATAAKAASPAAGSNDAKQVRQYVNFAFYKVDPAWRLLPDAEREQGVKDFMAVVDEYDQPGKLLVLSYSTTGIRADAEFMLWRVGFSLEMFHEMTAKLNRTGLGKYLQLTYSYLSMTKRSLYEDRISPEHEEDRTRIVPGKAKYLFVYPFVKKREWYLLTKLTRQGMMDEHIFVGNKYPSVKLNTSYAFGLDDHEFVVAFETDYPEDFLDLVMELRETQASLYTVRDTPIFTCMAMPLADALAALG